MTFNKGRLRFILIIIFLIILLTSIMLVIFSRPGPLLVVLLAAIIISLIIMINWHARRIVYRCPACGNNFRICAISDFLSPHTPEKKLVKCTKCGAVDWCSVID